MKYFYRIAIWVPVILMAIAIFGFSTQNGGESSGLSAKVSGFVIDIADDFNIISVDVSNRDKYIDIMQLPVRKAAHMTEYAIFAILVFIALTVDDFIISLRFKVTLLITLLFASSDEIHQLFVPGRSGKITDVCIDFLGAVIAMSLIKLFFYFKYKKINKKNLAD